MAFSFDSRIRYSEVDSSCRLSLTGLTNYFQDCSVFHSQSHDVGIRFLADNHIAWVLSSWQICINRLPLLNEQVKIFVLAVRLLAAGASVFDSRHWHDLIPCLEDVFPARGVPCPENVMPRPPAPPGGRCACGAATPPTGSSPLKSEGFFYYLFKFDLNPLFVKTSQTE